MAVSLTILYGSETGNAKDVATMIWRQALQQDLNVQLRCMNDFDLVQNTSVAQTVVFVCSTTGQGEVPDNMKTFWKCMLRRGVTWSLDRWNVAVLGLGDSSYQRFNFAARKLHSRLFHLNANQIMELGLADDQHDRGYDQIVQPWVSQFWGKMAKMYPDQVKDNVGPPLYSPSYSIVWVDDIEQKPKREHLQMCISNRRPPESCPVMAEIVQNQRITDKGHFQDVRLISFDLKPNAPYNPGDVMVIQPKNLTESQNDFFSIVSIADPDKPFYIRPNVTGISVPELFSRQPLTFRYLVSDVFDLQAVPRRLFFDILSHFAEDEMQKEKLLELSSPEGQEDLHDYCTRPRRTVVETLRDFASTVSKVPLEAWFDLLGTIRPRSFSIASCINTHEHLELIVAVVKYKSRLATPRLGLCSNWLARLAPGAVVEAWIKQGSFLFPAIEVPVVLVGAGTGLSPLRSFLHFRNHRGVRSSWLFFGCRYRDKDWLCEEDLRKMVSNGTLALSVAFSRDQPEKVYVQDNMKKQRALLYDLIYARDAVVFIAGRAKDMPQQVEEAIKDILKTEGGFNDNEAQKYIREMDASMRLQLEVWT
ncbi:NADPH dependent diflavin oxidoreductase 1 [Trichuris trichiura]|uniref:NADPH-dependent diflavin oxidoreductase 1 n=1 Tax=Trichuris trichiura TaxID=36087 RepID=A0A077Z8P9_TRITR|nr:NADPH dependent diflavin oxidoreductase 1 [Trichuris trichiura]